MITIIINFRPYRCTPRARKLSHLQFSPSLISLHWKASMRSIEETDKNLRKNSHTVKSLLATVILTKLKSRIGAFFRKIIFVTFWGEQQGGKLFLLRRKKKEGFKQHLDWMPKTVQSTSKWQVLETDAEFGNLSYSRMTFHAEICQQYFLPVWRQLSGHKRILPLRT